MKMIQCHNGHYYDDSIHYQCHLCGSSIYHICPYCEDAESIDNKICDSCNNKVLPLLYILNDQYRILSIDRIEYLYIYYIAENIHTGIKVVIRELFSSRFANGRTSDYAINVDFDSTDFFARLYRGTAQNFDTEMKILAALKHPSIENIIDIVYANKTIYSVREYHEGITLKELLANKTSYSEEEILEIMMPILEALKYSHSNGILHLDISEKNIYIEKDSNPILMNYSVTLNNFMSILSSREAIMVHNLAYVSSNMILVDTEAEYIISKVMGDSHLPFRLDEMRAIALIMYQMIIQEKPSSSWFFNFENLLESHKNIYSTNFLNAIVKVLKFNSEDSFKCVQEFQDAMIHGIESKEGYQ